MTDADPLAREPGWLRWIGRRVLDRNYLWVALLICTTIVAISTLTTWIVMTRMGWDDPLALRVGLMLAVGCSFATSLPTVLFILKMAAVLESTRQALQSSLAQVEIRVGERTAELQSLNAELDSFAYSVAHDLRSPLRAIDGFTRVLHERWETRMDDDDQRVMQQVLSATSRMNELIADILSLARVSQVELELGEVDLSEMAVQILADLRQREPGRSVQQVIAPAIVQRCDGRLARVALENILANAWKYTGRRADARIDFGRQGGSPGGSELFVADNGVGFDMARAGDLFKPFHRLHQDAEFEGTGIGLATVHRVMERHCGYVRGEGQEGQGARFSFSFSHGRPAGADRQPGVLPVQPGIRDNRRLPLK
jgi:light-regulated signal transduction histidine kinase (bacteriophytochrome)